VNNYGQPDDLSTIDGTDIGIVNQSSTTPKKQGNPKDDRDYSFDDDENANHNTPVALPSLRPRTRVSRTEDVEWDGSDTDDDTDEEYYRSTKTAAKKKRKTAAKTRAAATKKSAAAKPTVHSKTKTSTKHDVKRRGKKAGSNKGMKYKMSEEGSAKQSQVCTENNKNRRRYGKKFLPVLNESSITPVPKSISDTFPGIVTFEDVMVWAGDAETGEFTGVKVKNHLALGIWLGQTELRYLNQLMVSLGFQPKHEGWHNRLKKIYRKFEPIRDGSKSMIWTHPTFRPDSKVTDLTANH